jgi:hypothetical protein
MTCLWFSLGAPVSSTKKTDHHDKTEILLKVALSTLTPQWRLVINRLLAKKVESLGKKKKKFKRAIFLGL